MSTTIATAANVLPSTMPTSTIQTSSTESSICTLIKLDLPYIEDLNLSWKLRRQSSLTCKTNSKLLHKIEYKSLEIAEQALKIQLLRQQQSHALTMDNI